MKLEKTISLQVSDSIIVNGYYSDDGVASYADVDLSDIEKISVDSFGIHFRDANGHEFTVCFDSPDFDDALLQLESAIREYVVEAAKKK